MRRWWRRDPSAPFRTQRLLGVAACAVALAVDVGRADDGVLERGRALYHERCAPCHGEEGRGDGDAAYLMLRKPRNFRRAEFHFVSTWERRATDEDLFGTLTRGLPGTQMPTFEALPEADRRALVAVVKAFADRPWDVPASRAPSPDGTPGAGVVVVPPEPPDARTNRARAEELFRDACAPCHGATGRGDGRLDLVDSEGQPIRPRDFTRAAWKGDPSPPALYRRIITGIPGTPMPSNDWAYGDDAWYLLRYVLAFGAEPSGE